MDERGRGDGVMERERETVKAGDEAAQETPVAAPTEPEAMIGQLRAELRDRAAEVESLNDRLLRLHAEFENYKKRMARERIEFLKFANEGLILEFLPILDNLERAVEMARSRTDAQGVAEGLENILRLFQTTLEKAGVKAIEALEHEFDPALHQAVAQVESPGDQDNVVVEEVRKGYLLEGRLLRPSMVKVSKGAVPSSASRVSSADEDEPETRNF